MRACRTTIAAVAALFAAGLPWNAPGAQGAPGQSAAADSIYRRAVVLVNDGEGTAARALLDSMVAATRPASLEHAEALYWRATMAPSAAEAERDYRMVILDHAASPRVPDALLRLAQLELARGDRENAVRRLMRLDAEYPNNPERARTSYWLARAYLEQNDTGRGCIAVGEARARTPEGDVELRNQIDFIAQRCAGRVAGGQPAPAEQPTGVVSGAASPPPDPAPAADTRPSIPETPPVRDRPADRAAAPAAGTAAVWSVQVGAFGQRSQANTLVERMRGRGYQARVDDAPAPFPFRVRVGRYTTRAEAAAALQQMTARGIEGFLVQLDAR